MINSNYFLFISLFSSFHIFEYLFPIFVHSSFWIYFQPRCLTIWSILDMWVLLANIIRRTLSQLFLLCRNTPHGWWNITWLSQLDTLIDHILTSPQWYTIHWTLAWLTQDLHFQQASWDKLVKKSSASMSSHNAARNCMGSVWSENSMINCPTLWQQAFIPKTTTSLLT